MTPAEVPHIADYVAPQSTLAEAILRMKKREREAFVLGILAASPRIGDPIITRMAQSWVPQS